MMPRSFALGAFLIATLLVSDPSWSEECPVAESGTDVFLPQTTRPRNAMPNPPTSNDCAFYNWAWHMFLYLTQPQGDGRPAFLSFETAEDVYGPAVAKPFAFVSVADQKQRGILSLAPRSAKQFSIIPTLGGGFKQAGPFDAILVDQNRNAIYYAIHVNDDYARFIRDNGLNDVEYLLKPSSVDKGGGGPPANLEFRTGAVELKSAWQIVEDGQVSPRHFTTRARVPMLKNIGDTVEKDGEKTRDVTVALLSLHVVGVIDGHPEFVWATFEHADASGQRDIAPAATKNPEPGKLQEIQNGDLDYPLFMKGEKAENANKFLPKPSVDAAQKFSAATSVFRVFPGSQSNTSDEDESITDLNKRIGALFEKHDPAKTDYRRHYRLVGAVWLDKPDETFKEQATFTDNMLGGERRLSNMAMESFTQDETSFPNCFSCHHTQGKDAAGKFLPARRINVSHILQVFVRNATASK